MTYASIGLIALLVLVIVNFNVLRKSSMNSVVPAHEPYRRFLFGVIVFDLNGLKHINDTLGHEEGDRYIKNGCALICNQFSHSPVYRIGGDEFVVLLEGVDYMCRNALLAEFDRQIEMNLALGEVVVSTGISVFMKGRDSRYSDVFEHADSKMYERKRLLKSLPA